MKTLLLALIFAFVSTSDLFGQEYKEYYDSGKIKTTGQFDSNRKLNGEFITYAENGNIESTSYYFNKNTICPININESDSNDIIFDDFTFYFHTDTNSEKVTFKFELKNNTDSEIKLGKVRFRCPGPDVCNLTETLEGQIIDKKMSKYFEISFKNIDKKGMAQLTFFYKGKVYKRGFVFKVL